MKYIFISFMAFTFVSCDISVKKDSVNISTEVLDTIKTSPAITAMPDFFEAAFIKGTTKQGKTATVSFYGITIGKLKVVSGRIVACDPLHIDEYGKPFTQAFPNGEFPVQLSISEVGGEETVAFARINFSDQPVAKWEVALLKDQKPIPVFDEDIHGYGVDAGVGIFMDEAAIQHLDTKKIWDMESNHDLFKEMDKHNHGGWKYAIYNFGQHNLAAFTTGVGDGRYQTYIGYDAGGKPCRLLTDFKLLDWRKK